MNELIDLVSPELRARVESGELELAPGQNPNKPVVRDSASKALVKGSGRYPNANDAARTSRLTAHKRTTSYRQMLENLWPSEGDENVPRSLAWVSKQAALAAEGSPQTVTCTECGHRWNHAFKKDGLLLFKILELLTGKARETQDVNIKSESLVAVLNAREPVRDVIVHSIDPEIEKARREILDVD